MNFSKCITLVLFISATANAGLVVKNEVAFPDIYKTCYTDPEKVTVTWSGVSAVLENLQVSMTGNSNEFIIDGLYTDDYGEKCQCDSATGTCNVDTDGVCYIEITFAPTHSGVKNKKLNFYGTYKTTDSLGNETVNDVSVTIPVIGTSYPQNNPNAAPDNCPYQ